MGIPTHETCLGETFVYLKDVVSARGGMTMWKTLLPKSHHLEGVKSP